MFQHVHDRRTSTSSCTILVDFEIPGEIYWRNQRRPTPSCASCSAMCLLPRPFFLHLLYYYCCCTSVQQFHEYSSFMIQSPKRLAADIMNKSPDLFAHKSSFLPISNSPTFRMLREPSCSWGFKWVQMPGFERVRPNLPSIHTVGLCPSVWLGICHRMNVM